MMECASQTHYKSSLDETKFLLCRKVNFSYKDIFYKLVVMLIVLTAVPCGSSIFQGAAGIYSKETPASNFFNIFFEGVNAYKTSLSLLFSCVF
jgi:hypothetical protein